LTRLSASSYRNMAYSLLYIYTKFSVYWRWRQAILWCANQTVWWQRQRWNLAIAIASAAYTQTQLQRNTTSTDVYD